MKNQEEKYTQKVIETYRLKRLRKNKQTYTRNVRGKKIFFRSFVVLHCNCQSNQMIGLVIVDCKYHIMIKDLINDGYSRVTIDLSPVKSRKYQVRHFDLRDRGEVANAHAHIHAWPDDISR